MNKLLEVKEFDFITMYRDCNKNQKYKYLEPPVFQELVKFIREYVNTQNDADILDFMKITYQRHIGELISVQNYVGIIEMENGFQIQILPKISFDEEDTGNQKTKKIFINMLKSMKDFPGKVFNDAHLKVDSMNLYEIFINMYLQEVRQLIKKGIQSAYVNQEDNLSYYKGRLLTNQHINNNLIHKEKFYVSYDVFHPNRPENRLIKATLLKLQKLTTSYENVKRIRQLLIAFEMVEPSFHYEQDFSKVVMNRNTKAYESLMQWSKVFLLNQSFTTFSGENSARALLFPMEKVYESYVAKKIKSVLRQVGWDVYCQDHGHYLFLEPRRQFALRPDIVCQKGNRTVVMDTKWKRLVNNQRLNYGINQGDMYQMYAYSKKYNAQEIWLLYPVNDEVRNLQSLSFDTGDGTVVKIQLIDLAHIEETMQKILIQLETEIH